MACDSLNKSVVSKWLFRREKVEQRGDHWLMATGSYAAIHHGECPKGQRAGNELDPSTG